MLVGTALVDHLIATGVLFEDQGLMWIGLEDEPSYGFRHFTVRNACRRASQATVDCQVTH